MIDLHCHLLPAIDDGAANTAVALEMARMAVADGIDTVFCTPHIYPGLYENDAASIRQGVVVFQQTLNDAGIALNLSSGADAHLVPDLLSRLRADQVPTLGGSRYFLLEPPHHVAPPRFEEHVFGLIAAGYVPLITHPERLTWIEGHHDAFRRLAERGAWLQITAGSLTGRFGGEARYWGERLLDEGCVHVLATDAHSANGRPPLLAEGREAAARWVGAVEAQLLVQGRPSAVLANAAPSEVPAIPVLADRPDKRGWWSKWFSKA